MKNVLFYATTAFAATATVQKRQASVINDAVAAVSQSVSALNDAVTAFQGVDQVADLQSSAQSVLDAIASAQSTIEPLDVLEQSDAIQLAQPISDLAELVETSVDNVIGQRAAFDSAGVSTVVLSTLTDLRDASTQLSDTILSKIPDELQTVGQGIANRISTALDRGVQSYSDATDGGDDGEDGETSTSAGEATPTATSEPSEETTAPGGTYSVVPPATTSAPGATTSRPAATSVVATYPGAAGQNAASGYGAVAMAALAVAAML